MESLYAWQCKKVTTMKRVHLIISLAALAPVALLVTIITIRFTYSPLGSNLGKLSLDKMSNNQSTSTTDAPTTAPTTQKDNDFAATVRMEQDSYLTSAYGNVLNIK